MSFCQLNYGPWSTVPESNGRPLLCRQMRKPTFANRAQALAWVEGLEPPFSVLETDRFAAILHPCEFWLGEMDSNHYPFVQSEASCQLDDLRIVWFRPEDSNLDQVLQRHPSYPVRRGRNVRVLQLSKSNKKAAFLGAAFKNPGLVY